MSDEANRTEEFTGLDRVVHEPTRLHILYLLSGGGDSDFMFLRNVIGVTHGNLSKHLDKLVEAGLVDIHKEFVLRRPKTRISITEAGEAALEEHWRQLNKLREKSKQVRVTSQDTRDEQSKA